MKTKEYIKVSKLIFYSVLAGLLFIGCAKESTTKVQTTSNTTSQSTIASDNLTLNNEIGQFADEAIQVICNHSVSIVGADIDTSQISAGVITIYYSGKEADGTKSRSGSDSIHQTVVGGKIVPWGTSGTTANITMGCINSPGYEVTYLSNNSSARINGTMSLTYLRGGYFQNITPGDSLAVKMKGAVSYTFNDNLATITYYPFNLNSIRRITSNGTIYSAISTGDTSIGDYYQVSDWGTDRFGDTYFTSTTTPVIQNITTASLSYDPLSGVRIINGISEPILCTFGVNNSGDVITSGTPYGFNISWSNNGGGASAVIPYYY